MKRYSMLLLVVLAIGLNGCTAVQMIQTASTLSNARGGYQVLQTRNMISDVKDATPVFRGYDTVAVSVSMKPRDNNADSVNDAIGSVYCTNVKNITRSLGMDVGCMDSDGGSGKVLVVTVVEEVSGSAERIAGGNDLHVVVTYSDKATGKQLASETFRQLYGYRAVADMLAMSALKKIVAGGPSERATETEKRAWADRVVKLMNAGGTGKYPVVSEEDKAILAKK